MAKKTTSKMATVEAVQKEFGLTYEVALKEVRRVRSKLFLKQSDALSMEDFKKTKNK